MLHDAESAAAGLFSEASAVLGYDLWGLISQGPEEKLNQTEFTQPALLTASIALYRLGRAQGLPEPDVVAGHSLGEYSALVVAGVLEFADAVKLVQQRGQFMQTAVPLGQGGMAAVLGLDDHKVKEICNAVAQDEVVQAANFNAPGQVVIAGSNDALTRAIDACKEAGAKRALALAVSAPFHSALMMPAADNMALALAEVSFSAPIVPIIQNVDAQSHADPDELRDNLVSQMFSAVLWTDTVQSMQGLGVETIVECGPGKVLTGLSKRIDKSIKGLSINTLSGIDDCLQALASE